jgi:hypothetical protein
LFFVKKKYLTDGGGQFVSAYSEWAFTETAILNSLDSTLNWDFQSNYA